MTKWILPFLDDHIDAASLVKSYEMSDERVLKGRQLYVYVAAAYVFLGNPQKAMRVLETEFGRPGARRQYSAAFTYVARRLEQRG
jgi:hypothetical protein